MYKHLNTFAIGGLQSVGYVNEGDNLIVLSSQGRGIFNCLTGEKIFRDDYDWWRDFDPESSSVKGFGGEVGKMIKTYGLYNPNEQMPQQTADGYKLSLTQPQPDDPPFEKYLVQSIFIAHQEDKIFVSKDGPCEFRAFGFSETRNSFIVASSCDLVIWGKAR